MVSNTESQGSTERRSVCCVQSNSNFDLFPCFDTIFAPGLTDENLECSGRAGKVCFLFPMVCCLGTALGKVSN